MLTMSKPSRGAARRTHRGLTKEMCSRIPRIQMTASHEAGCGCFQVAGGENDMAPGRHDVRERRKKPARVVDVLDHVECRDEVELLGELRQIVQVPSHDLHTATGGAPSGRRVDLHAGLLDRAGQRARETHRRSTRHRGRWSPRVGRPTLLPAPNLARSSSSVHHADSDPDSYSAPSSSSRGWGLRNPR